MVVDVKIKDVWQKLELIGSYTGEIVIPGFIITVENGLITAVVEDDSPEA